METPKGLFWQTVKVQMKCHKCGTVFYDKILSSGTEVCNNLKISTCEPLKYIRTLPYFLYVFVWENPSEYKGLMPIFHVLAQMILA